jgi:hypothetical protein
LIIILSTSGFLFVFAIVSHISFVVAGSIDVRLRGTATIAVILIVAVIIEKAENTGSSMITDMIVTLVGTGFKGNGTCDARKPFGTGAMIIFNVDDIFVKGFAIGVGGMTFKGSISFLAGRAVLTVQRTIFNTTVLSSNHGRRQDPA